MGVAQTGMVDSGWLMDAARTVRPGVTEIMTHPGLDDDLKFGETRLTASRAAELAALCNPAVREEFKRNGVELIHYGLL